MVITIHLAGHLRDHAGGSVDLEVGSAKDILDVIAQLDLRFPQIGDRILDEHDRTRPYVNIFVNECNVRDLDGEATKTADGDVIYILPSVAGGNCVMRGEEGST